MTIIDICVVIITVVLVIERGLAMVGHVNQTITMKKAYEVISQLQAGISFGAQVGAMLGSAAGGLAANFEKILKAAAPPPPAKAAGKPVDLDGAKSAGGRDHHAAG